MVNISKAIGILNKTTKMAKVADSPASSKEVKVFTQKDFPKALDDLNLTSMKSNVNKSLKEAFETKKETFADKILYKSRQLLNKLNIGKKSEKINNPYIKELKPKDLNTETAIKEYKINFLTKTNNR